MSNKKEENQLWRGLMCVSIGLLFLFIITRYVGVYEGMISFYIGLSIVLLGLADISIILYRNNKALPAKIVRYHNHRMRNANKAIVWVWVVCLTGICLYSIAFYVLLYPTLLVIGVVEGLVTWDANAAFTLNLAKTVLNWHPILFIVGLLIWAFVNSQRREDITYPVY